MGTPFGCDQRHAQSNLSFGTMNWLRKIAFRLQPIFQKNKIEVALSDEIRTHLELATEANIAAGISPEEAREAALRQFGGVDQIKESYRSERGIPWIEHSIQDLRYAFRQLAKSKLYAAVIVLTLALGIGAVMAVYSVVDELLLHPLPESHPERFVQIGERYSPKDGEDSTFYRAASPTLRALESNSDLFSDLTWADDYGPRFEAGSGESRKSVYGEMVSPNFFAFFGIHPLLGRTFIGGEGIPSDNTGALTEDSVMELSYVGWKTLFGGDPKVVGQTIEVSHRQLTVIGVMPSNFCLPQPDVLFWVPAMPKPPFPGDFGARSVRIYAQSKPGIDAKQMQASLAVVAARLADAPGSFWARAGKGIGSRFWILPLSETIWVNYDLIEFRHMLFGLLAASGFVLLIVCANVANLTLANTERRQHEFAIRAALGAGQSRLMRQVLTETALLAGLGGLAGLAFTRWSMTFLLTLDVMPRLKPVQVNGQVLMVSILLSLLTGVLLGLAPAWHAGRAQLNERLKLGTPGSKLGRRYRDTLVVVQVGLAFVLLIGAGLMGASIIRLLASKPGFDPKNMLVVSPGWPKIAPDDVAAAASRTVLIRELRERLAGLPGVQAVGVRLGESRVKLILPGRLAPLRPVPATCGVDENDWLRVARVPLIAGRYLSSQDVGEQAGNVVVNESFAWYSWGSENPIGKEFRVQRDDGTMSKRYQVVGVVRAPHLERYEDGGTAPTFFRPAEAGVVNFGAIFIRTNFAPAQLIPAIRKELRALAPQGVAPQFKIVQQDLYDSTQGKRKYRDCLGFCAGVGLVLLSLGIYAVLAFSVVRRTGEIGIRMALGASPQQVMRMVLTEGAGLVGVGLIAGMIAAFWTTRLLGDGLFDAGSINVIVWLAAAVFIGAIALFACYSPARRAANVDPIIALRAE